MWWLVLLGYRGGNILHLVCSGVPLRFSFVSCFVCSFNTKFSYNLQLLTISFSLPSDLSPDVLGPTLLSVVEIDPTVPLEWLWHLKFFHLLPPVWYTYKTSYHICLVGHESRSFDHTDLSLLLPLVVLSVSRFFLRPSTSWTIRRPSWSRKWGSLNPHRFR